MLQKQGENLCFLIKGYAQVGIAGFLLREQLGNDFIKNPALRMAFRNGKGTDVPGNTRSCPWNGYVRKTQAEFSIEWGEGGG